MENDELSLEIMLLKEKYEGRETKWKDIVNRLELENSGLRGVCEERISQCKGLERETIRLKEKIEEMESESFTPSKQVFKTAGALPPSESRAIRAGDELKLTYERFARAREDVLTLEAGTASLQQELLQQQMLVTHRDEEIEKLSRRNLTLHQQYKELTDKYHFLIQDYESFQEKHSDDLVLISQKDKEIIVLNEQIACLENRLKIAQREQSNAEHEMKLIEDNFIIEKEELNKEKLLIYQESFELKNEIQNLMEINDTQMLTIKKQASNVESLSLSVSALNAQKQNNEKHVTDLSEQIAHVKSQLKYYEDLYNTQISTFKEENECLKLNNQEKEHQLSVSTSEINRLNKEAREYWNSLQMTQSELSKFMKENSSLKKSIGNMELSYKSKIEQEISYNLEKKDAISSMKAQLEVLNQKILILSKEKDLSDLENEEFKRQLSYLEEENNTKTTEIKDLKTTLRDTFRAHAELKAKVKTNIIRQPEIVVETIEKSVTNNDNTYLQATNESLRTDIELLQKKLESLKEENEGLFQAKQHEKKINKELNNRVKQLESQFIS